MKGDKPTAVAEEQERGEAMATEKKKRAGKIQSINFKDDIYEILTKEVNAIDSNYSSRINALIRYTYGLTPEVKEDIARYCRQREIELENDANAEKDLFWKKKLKDMSKEYSELVDLLTSGKGVHPVASAKPRFKICQTCGKVFFPERHGNEEYCCFECRQEGIKRANAKSDAAPLRKAWTRASQRIKNHSDISYIEVDDLELTDEARINLAEELIKTNNKKGLIELLKKEYNERKGNQPDEKIIAWLEKTGYKRKQRLK